ncbi:methyltransferase family protein [Chloroflexota bacterium]
MIYSGLMARRSFVSRFVVRYVLKKDMLYFFLPWITVLIIEGYFCVWESVKQPRSLFSFPLESIIGLALFIIGFVLIMVGHFTLWRNYSSFLVIHKDHQLITHGIYRFIRNPIYLGTIMSLIGLPIYAGSLYGFLTSLVLIPIFLNRIRMEEGMLADYFQDSFQKYKKTAKRLIPFIY